MTASPALHPALGDLLREWLPKQRWYGGKGRAVTQVEPLTVTELVADDERTVRHLLLRVTPEEGEADLYQLLVGEHRGTLPELLLHAEIGSADGVVFYDGVYDHGAADVLLQHLGAGDRLGSLDYTCAEEVEAGLPSRVMSAEQSNTSIVFGDRYILKLFRRLQPGANPDIEVTRALAEAGSTHVARPLAWVEDEVDGERTTLGLLQVFAKGATEGWAMATASVRDLFAEADLHADEVGGDFAAESERLGAATAEVHALMAQALPTSSAGPEQIASAVRQLHSRLDEALRVVPDLERYADALRATYDELGRRTEPVPVQRVHGDYHLGQVLRTQDGWLLLDFEGERTTLGLLQVFAKGATEGWAMATASVRDLFGEADLHADEVGGDFAAESERLGAATAEVHALMAQALPTGSAGPEQIASAVRQLHSRLDEALRVVPDLEPYADALRATYDELGRRTEPVPVQRVHGDYHLGQVLRTQDGWLLLDFEGEPARPLVERTALMSPLRDVAGMLRSYDYAARHLLAERGDDPQLAYRAAEWADRNREAFCDGYARAAGSDPRDEAVLLRAFELDKAVYEVVYEARNRPSWLPIPMGSIERLAASATSEGDHQ